MPDFGDLGRGLLKGAKDKAGQAQQKIRDLRDSDDDKPADPPTAPIPAAKPEDIEPVSAAEPVEVDQGEDDPDEHASEEDVRELVELFSKVLAEHRPPSGPITQPWALGVGDLLAEHPKVPDRLRGVVRKLDRFGGIAINPEQIGFDGDEVDWDDVKEVRIRHVVDYLYADAAMDQLSSLPVPWFPGRKKVAEALGKAMLTVAMVTMHDLLSRSEDNLQVPAEIVHRGMLGRSKTMGPGIVATLVLLDPAVKEAITATAQARGIPVRATGDELMGDATRRAEVIRSKLADFERLRKKA